MEGNQKQGRVHEDGHGGWCGGRIQSGKGQAGRGVCGLAQIKPDPGCSSSGHGRSQDVGNILGGGPEWWEPWQSEHVREGSCLAPCLPSWKPSSFSRELLGACPTPPTSPLGARERLWAPCWGSAIPQSLANPGSTPGTIPECKILEPDMWGN